MDPNVTLFPFVLDDVVHDDSEGTSDHVSESTGPTGLSALLENNTSMVGETEKEKSNTERPEPGTAIVDEEKEEPEENVSGVGQGDEMTKQDKGHEGAVTEHSPDASAEVSVSTTPSVTEPDRTKFNDTAPTVMPTTPSTTERPITEPGSAIVFPAPEETPPNDDQRPGYSEGSDSPIVFPSSEESEPTDDQQPGYSKGSDSSIVFPVSEETRPVDSKRPGYSKFGDGSPGDPFSAGARIPVDITGRPIPVGDDGWPVRPAAHDIVLGKDGRPLSDEHGQPVPFPALRRGDDPLLEVDEVHEHIQQAEETGPTLEQAPPSPPPHKPQEPDDATLLLQYMAEARASTPTPGQEGVGETSHPPRDSRG